MLVAVLEVLHRMQDPDKIFGHLVCGSSYCD